MYRGKVVFILRLTWTFVWSVMAGFASNQLMLIVRRTLTEFVSAEFLPAGILLIGNGCRPGPRKNLIFGLYGAAAPLSVSFVMFTAGVSGQFWSCGWFFSIGAILILQLL